jgi:nitroreductase
MNVLEAIASRRSVRAYADQPVPREALEKLLLAATQAPSAMNTQQWAFGIIEGKQALQELGERARVTFLQILESRGETGYLRDMLSNADYQPFYGAPALVIIYATGGDQFGQVNCSLAAQNLMLAATELGLGTCWIGIAMPLLGMPETKAEFGVPDDCEVIAPLIVGVPAGDVPEHQKNPPNVLFWQ